MPLRALLPVVLVAVLAAAPATAASARAKPRLRAFDDCSHLIRYGNRHVERLGARTAPGLTPAPLPAPVAAPGPAQDEAAAGGGSPGSSTTNVQEAGVDEPDTVKTDGSTIFAFAGGHLRAVDVTQPEPRLVGRLALEDGYDHQMLLRGDRLLVLYRVFGGGAVAIDARVPREPPSLAAVTAPDSAFEVTRLALVNVADPAHPRLLRTLDVESNLVAARLTGDTARVVLSATPRGFWDPDVSSRRAKAWLPAGTFKNAGTKRGRARGGRTRALIPCRSVRHARAFAGLQTLTVLTFDLDEGLNPVDADGVMTGAETVYASAGNLYVATQRYDEDLLQRVKGEAPDGITTEVHRFETADPAVTRYRGGARVPGFLLSQFSMSEHKGVLRVASTDEPPWFTSGDEERSQSYVTSLRLEETHLTRLGQVGGLGRGERIFAVRFLDDVGYVVTFRQVDPLYTVDLADPATPRVRGELKIRGYSAYLHPIGEGRLLGIGQDATKEGRTLGTQVSLFDVSKLDGPELLHQASAGANGFSSVEYDHHAFLWWPATQLAVLPVDVFETVIGPGDTISGQQSFSGAVGYTVAGDRLIEAGRVSHDASEFGTPSISRSLVVADRLYTLSEGGLAASRLDTLARIGFAPFSSP